jgi:predicted nuclease of predicted toxin-antitoxin system
MQVRFHLDEQMPKSLARSLRRRGIDVTTSHDANLLGAEDTDQLAFAFANQRTLVTHDADFLRLAASGVQNPGIAYCHSEKYTIRELLRALLQLADSRSNEEMANRIHFL